MYKREGSAFSEVINPSFVLSYPPVDLVFSADGRYLATASAGAPYVEAYAQAFNPVTQFVVPKIQVGVNTYIKS